ncbi:hypothetical protein [Pararhodobacter sp. CCB-MM2]|uniref:hypothetical protein n=1 Tax=Pararhodobacter sp. CCB-MM2 TaxID=1786003 RepID=UPI000832AEA1|nr:hypothetical protein [Pararhodobacter sp. CCB-MM2]
MNAPIRHFLDAGSLYGLIRAVSNEATIRPHGAEYRSHAAEVRRAALSLALDIAILAAEEAGDTPIANLLSDLQRGQRFALDLAKSNDDAIRDRLDDTASELAEDVARMFEAWGVDCPDAAPLPHESIARGFKRINQRDVPNLAHALRGIERNPTTEAAGNAIMAAIYAGKEAA